MCAYVSECFRIFLNKTVDTLAVADSERPSMWSLYLSLSLLLCLPLHLYNTIPAQTVCYSSDQQPATITTAALDLSLLLPSHSLGRLKIISKYAGLQAMQALCRDHCVDTGCDSSTRCCLMRTLPVFGQWAGSWRLGTRRVCMCRVVRVGPRWAAPRAVRQSVRAKSLRSRCVRQLVPKLYLRVVCRYLSVNKEVLACEWVCVAGSWLCVIQLSFAPVSGIPACLSVPMAVYIPVLIVACTPCRNRRRFAVRAPPSPSLSLSRWEVISRLFVCACPRLTGCTNVLVYVSLLIYATSLWATTTPCWQLLICCSATVSEWL